MNHEKTFVMIDGHNLLFQMFYGMPSRIVNQDGKAIQGVLGFVGALIKIIKLTDPSYLVVLFDGQHPSQRTGISADYKANRVDYSEVPEEENPFSQLQDIYHALEFMGIRFTEIEEVETDDVIAAYVSACEKDFRITIASWDSDFFQLISGQTSVLRYRGKNTIICGAGFVENRFGIPAALYADFKALTGDKADNIKGAEKVGVKTAASLLKQFGSLEGILAHAEQIQKVSVRKSILENRNRLLTNYKLIKLENAAKIPFELEELSYRYNGVSTNEVLRGIELK